MEKRWLPSYWKGLGLFKLKLRGCVRNGKFSTWFNKEVLGYLKKISILSQIILLGYSLVFWKIGDIVVRIFYMYVGEIMVLLVCTKIVYIPFLNVVTKIFCPPFQYLIFSYRFYRRAFSRILEFIVSYFTTQTIQIEQNIYVNKIIKLSWYFINEHTFETKLLTFI